MAFKQLQIFVLEDFLLLLKVEAPIQCRDVRQS